jgi:glycosyltransferase involved in cell wall biosynthesis
LYIKILKNLSFYLNKERRKLLNLAPFFQRKPGKDFPKISAYLSIYNDADILDVALNSIAKYVDELIVVDGAYEWMAPFLEATGRNPLQSDSAVYEKIDASGIPYKVINRIWKNEVEKRIAGYEATTHQFTMRVDADEVIVINDENLQKFFASGCALAEMYMPNYAAPGWVIQGKRLIDKYRTYPRQSLLFNKAKISSKEHLRYLWLVLTADELPNSGQRQKIFPVYEKPVAFCAHLTNWRFVESSATRGSFYTMNWMRQNGAPWVKEIGARKINNFQQFFNYVSPDNFLEIMRNGIIVQGDIQLKKHEKLSKTPLTDIQESVFSGLYKDFLKKLQSRVLDILKQGSIALIGYPLYIDLSMEDTLAKIAPDGYLRIKFSEPLASVQVRLLTLHKKAPFSVTRFIPYVIEVDIIVIDISCVRSVDNYLRRTIELQIASKSRESPLVSFTGYFSGN